jgi:hypothetical protein
MMRDHVHIDRPDEIVRARQGKQRPSCEIADVEKPELPELQADAGRARILVCVQCVAR